MSRFNKLLWPILFRTVQEGYALLHKQSRQSMQIIREGKSLSNLFDMENIRHILDSVKHIDGDMAELGVCRGATAKLIATICPHKTVHLFDTFAGLPCKDESCDTLNLGDCPSDFDEVKKYLAEYSNVVFHVGLFPETAKGLEARFCFVNLDADQYRSMLDGLIYFYPHMVLGGIIVLHEYQLFAGVRKAVEDYSVKLICVPVGDSQGVIIKS